jgi:hypothetical protein
MRLWVLTQEVEMEKIIAIAAVVLIVGFILVRKLFSMRDGNFQYIKVGDPNAQGVYDKGKGADILPLTAKELLELSWKFLYDVTEAVLYRFSDTSRKAVNDCGEALVKNGARYTHVIDYTPVQKIQKTRSVDDDSSDTVIQR